MTYGMSTEVRRQCSQWKPCRMCMPKLTSHHKNILLVTLQSFISKFQLKERLGHSCLPQTHWPWVFPQQVDATGILIDYLGLIEGLCEI
jgi:hypothetical protein